MCKSLQIVLILSSGSKAVLRAATYLLAIGLAALIAACGGSGGGSGQMTSAVASPPSSTFQTSLIDLFSNLDDFNQPVAAIQSPSDNSRWFIVEQSGIVRSFQNNTAVSEVAIFIDIRNRVDNSANESGLLGMAFHPDFSTNAQVYVSYTETGTPLTSVISKFTSLDEGQSLDPNSEEIIIRVQQDQGNHNGAQISFGEDGYLYISLGDGGGAGDPLDRAEDTTNLLGSVLRLDVDNGSPYSIPLDNPFSGNPFCSEDHSSINNCPEIFAWGFRNPWRWSFDRLTNELWLGDVGQDALEEVNIVEVGNNYGWNHREGNQCFEPMNNCEADGLTEPVAVYGHDEGESITGGYVYRGTDIPDLFGAYIFGDFESGTIWSLRADTSGEFSREILLNTRLNISSFAEDVDGELFVIDYVGGRLYQIVEEQ